MKIKAIFLAIGILIGIAATAAYYAYPYSMASKIRMDLNLSSQSPINIVDKSGDYYEIATGSGGNEGGGYDVIVKKLPNGHFMNLWRGTAAAPPCSVVYQYTIPEELLGAKCQDN